MTASAVVWPVAGVLITGFGALLLDLARQAALLDNAEFTQDQLPPLYVLPTGLLVLGLLTIVHEVAHAAAGKRVGRPLQHFTLGALPSAELGPATRDRQQMLVSAAGPVAQALASLLLIAASHLALAPIVWPRPTDPIAVGLELAHSSLVVGATLGLGHFLLAALLPYSRNSDCWKFWASAYAVLRKK